jgi:hypothetical protein
MSKLFGRCGERSQLFPPRSNLFPLGEKSFWFRLVRLVYEFSRLKKIETFTVIPAVFKRESICKDSWMPD